MRIASDLSVWYIQCARHAENFVITRLILTKPYGVVIVLVYNQGKRTRL